MRIKYGLPQIRHDVELLLLSGDPSVYDSLSDEVGLLKIYVKIKDVEDEMGRWLFSRSRKRPRLRQRKLLR